MFSGIIYLSGELLYEKYRLRDTLNLSTFAEDSIVTTTTKSRPHPDCLVVFKAGPIRKTYLFLRLSESDLDNFLF